MDSAVLRILDPKFTSQFLSKAGTFRSNSIQSSRPVHVKPSFRGVSSHFQEALDTALNDSASERKRPKSGLATGYHKKRHSSFGLVLNSAVGRHNPLHPLLLFNGKKQQTGYQPSRGDMLELKELIEQSFKCSRRPEKKPARRIRSPLLKGENEFFTQESTDDPSLKDTFDCKVLNSELHYIENLAKAGDPSERRTDNITGDCPLQAVRSFEQQRSRRNPLHLHEMVIPSPRDRLVSDPSELFPRSPKQIIPQKHRRLPTAIYKYRRKGKDKRNEDCLKVTKVVCPLKVGKAQSISEGEGGHLASPHYSRPSRILREKRPSQAVNNMETFDSEFEFVQSKLTE